MVEVLSITHRDGATDECLVVVSLVHPFKQLQLLGVISVIAAIVNVNGLVDASCEIHQGIPSLPSSQCLIATSKSIGERKRRRF